jgi:hypothetical protein
MVMLKKSKIVLLFGLAVFNVPTTTLKAVNFDFFEKIINQSRADVFDILEKIIGPRRAPDLDVF